MPGTADSNRFRVAVLVVVGALVAATAGLVATTWLSGTSDSHSRPAPRARQGLSPPASASHGSGAGAARELDARNGGRRVWLAPEVADEPGLAEIQGPLPGTIEVDESYPILRPGGVRSATTTFSVVVGTAKVVRVLVLDDAGQLFELDLDRALSAPAAKTSGPLVSVSLSPHGTSLTLHLATGRVGLDLNRLTTHRVRTDVAPRDSGRDLAASSGGLVARLSSRTDVPGLPTNGDRTPVIVVDGTRPAMLVLDGERLPGCCAVVGWLDSRRVLVESRSADLLRVLAWNVETGRVALVSTISPVVAADSYVRADYADLRSG